MYRIKYLEKKHGYKMYFILNNKIDVNVAIKQEKYNIRKYITKQSNSKQKC